VGGWVLSAPLLPCFVFVFLQFPCRFFGPFLAVSFCFFRAIFFFSPGPVFRFLARRLRPRTEPGRKGGGCGSVLVLRFSRPGVRRFCGVRSLSLAAFRLLSLRFVRPRRSFSLRFRLSPCPRPSFSLVPFRSPRPRFFAPRRRVRPAFAARSGRRRLVVRFAPLNPRKIHSNNHALTSQAPPPSGVKTKLRRALFFFARRFSAPPSAVVSDSRGVFFPGTPRSFHLHAAFSFLVRGVPFIFTRRFLSRYAAFFSSSRRVFFPCTRRSFHLHAAFSFLVRRVLLHTTHASLSTPRVFPVSFPCRPARSLRPKNASFSRSTRRPLLC